MADNGHVANGHVASGHVANGHVAFEKFDYNSSFFICGRCGTHLVSLQGGCTIDFSTWEILFPQPYTKNLEIQPQQQFIRAALASLLYCRRCNTEMGVIYIREDNPDNAAIEGTVSLNLPLVRFWNGFELFSFLGDLPMLPLPLPLQPPHDHGPPFFLCKTCNAHVAWMQELFLIDLKTSRILFSDSIGLVVDPPERHWIHQNGTTGLAFVNCGECNEVLGMKMVSEEDPNYGFRVELVGLDMTLLKIWYGTDHQLFSLMRRLPMLYTLPESENPDDQLPPP